MKPVDMMLGPPVSREGESFSSGIELSIDQEVWRECNSQADIELWLHWFLDVAEVDFHFKVEGNEVAELNHDIKIHGGRGALSDPPEDAILSREEFDKFPVFDVPTPPARIALIHPTFYAEAGVGEDFGSDEYLAVYFMVNILNPSGALAFNWDGGLKIYGFKGLSGPAYTITLTKERARVVETDTRNPDFTITTTYEYEPTRLFSNP